MLELARFLFVVRGMINFAAGLVTFAPAIPVTAAISSVLFGGLMLLAIVAPLITYIVCD